MKKNVAILCIMVIFTLVFAAGCNLLLGNHEIEYEITGTATTVDITMNNQDSGTEQHSNVSVPWTKSFSVNVSGGYYFAYISAQNNGSSGSVTVKIYKNGKLFKQATSSGAYAIATASGSIK